MHVAATCSSCMAAKRYCGPFAAWCMIIAMASSADRGSTASRTCTKKWQVQGMAHHFKSMHNCRELGTWREMYSICITSAAFHTGRSPTDKQLMYQRANASRTTASPRVCQLQWLHQQQQQHRSWMQLPYPLLWHRHAATHIHSACTIK